ncbi:MAG: nucleotide exchange factor GrpE [Solirubrobacteraceae bacterium]
MTPGPGFGPGGAAARGFGVPGGSAGRVTPADAEHARASAEATPPSEPDAGDAHERGAPAGAPSSAGGSAPPDGGPGEPSAPNSADQEKQGSPTAPADAEAATVESELAAKAAKADEYLALAQRTKADFENYRKRATREAAAAQERGAVRLALELLPAIDNLERALAHADSDVAGDTGNGDSFVAGIRHVHADVIAALGRAGIECYSPQGELFDPQLHEAVAQQPIEGTEPGVIVEVYQRGYRLGDAVVRPARVVVAG